MWTRLTLRARMMASLRLLQGIRLIFFALQFGFMLLYCYIAYLIFDKLHFSAGKACLTIPCTQIDINDTIDTQQEAFLSSDAIAVATTAGFSAPSVFPFTTKNEGEIEVGDSIYFTCTDYIKVFSKIPFY